MRAAVNTRYGPPSVVAVEEVATPSPGPRDVLVEVRCGTVNRTDCGIRGAHPWFARAITGLTRPRLTINGGEFAGVVAAVGTEVTTLGAGDRVFGYSERTLGAHAEFLTIPADGPIATIPDGVTDEAAAASTEASQYALANLRAGALNRDSDVVVFGATGGIGSAAVQLLASRGVAVTAVCPQAHAGTVAELGAARVIGLEDFPEPDRRYDAVFDAVGKSSFTACRPSLGPRGRYLTTDFGPKSQNAAAAVLTAASPGRRAIIGLPRPWDQRFVGFIRSELASGRFRPLLDQEFPLADIVDAYEYVETGQKIGNVIVRVSAADPRDSHAPAPGQTP